MSSSTSPAPRAVTVRTVANPPDPSKLYSQRGTYPAAAGLPSGNGCPFSQLLVGMPTPPPAPAITVDEALWSKYFADAAPSLLDPVLAHPALQPHYLPSLPFLKPIEHLGGEKRAAILQALGGGGPSPASLAFNKLRNNDCETQAHFELYSEDLPPYLAEPLFPCDNCTTKDKPQKPCPCFMVNLGRLTTETEVFGMTSYHLSCYNCAANSLPCKFSIAQETRTFWCVNLHARVHLYPDGKGLTRLVYWTGQKSREASRPVTVAERRSAVQAGHIETKYAAFARVKKPKARQSRPPQLDLPWLRGTNPEGNSSTGPEKGSHSLAKSRVKPY